MANKKGLRTVRRSTLGETYIESGVVVDNSKIGCPDVDTVYLQFGRKGEPTYTLCITPSEAELISQLLLAAAHSVGMRGD